MPNLIREDLLTSFLDPLIWPFGCRAERQRAPRHLYVGNMRVSIDHAGFVYRTPMDRVKNRAGILEGPIFAFQARHETHFSGADSAGKEDEGKLDRMDVLREVGALLVLAQERAREGKPEIVPGQGKWWAEKPRWGGGTGEPVGTPLQEDDESFPTEVTDALAARAKNSAAASGDGAGASRLLFGSSNNGEDDHDGPRSAKRRSIHPGGGSGEEKSEGHKARDKKRKAQLRRRMIAQSHEMPRPLWDKRVEYRQIGKDTGELYDDVRAPFHLPLPMLTSSPKKC